MSEPSKGISNVRVLLFMVVLCCTCALILATLATSLKDLQDRAEELNRSREMLIAAKIYDHGGYFQIRTKENQYVPAKLSERGVLIPGSEQDLATSDEVFSIYKNRLHAFLVDAEGRRYSFEEAGIDKTEYISENRKRGYARLPYKLAYEVSPNGVPADTLAERGVDPEAYLFPVNGFGLWDAIYGYIAVDTDGNRVLGISWYEHKETPGLGANIASPKWQKQFFDKNLFLEGSGSMDFAPIGITVVRGKVDEVYASAPSKVHSAVDGMAGATLTGNGVTKAYKESLEPYRPFLISLNKRVAQNQ